MFKFHHLRDFLAVARFGGLRPAARHLQMAQSSLTKSIRQLERDLKVPLFERSRSGATLTPVGKAFLRRAETIIQEVGRAQDEVRMLTGGQAGSVAFGFSTVPTLLFLGAVLNAFRIQYPDAVVRVISGSIPAMFSQLRDGSLDFSVGPEPDPDLTGQLEVERLFTNSRIIVCRQEHPLAAATTLLSLLDCQWIVTGATGRTASEFDDTFRIHGLARPLRVVHCEAALAIKALLVSTDSVAVVPRQWIESPITAAGMVRIYVREAVTGPDIVIVRRPELPLTPAAECLLTIIRRAARKVEPPAR